MAGCNCKVLNLYLRAERGAIMARVYSSNYFDPEVMTAVFIQAIGRYAVSTLRYNGAQHHTRIQLTEPLTCKPHHNVVLQPAKRTPPNTSRNKSSNTQRTENKTTDVVIQLHSRKLLMMDILMSETC
jgi:hypothetical protein